MAAVVVLLNCPMDREGLSGKYWDEETVQEGRERWSNKNYVVKGKNRTWHREEKLSLIFSESCFIHAG